MYRCERCGGTFAQFNTPGQCPLCKFWASVRCAGCSYTAHADVFINNGDRCPKCGARVSVPVSGSGETSAASAVGGLALLVFLLVLCVCGVIVGLFRENGGDPAPKAPPASIQHAKSDPELLARQKALRDAEERNQAKQDAELVARQESEEKERAELAKRQQAEREKARARQAAKEQVERSARTVEYRCSQVYTKKTDPQFARRMGERLNYLQIQWKGDDIYYAGRYQYTVMRYGASLVWQRKEFQTELEARNWLFAMHFEGFEAHLLSERLLTGK